MKRILLTIVAVMMVTLMVKAQESLAGRVYYCGNLMQKVMDKELQDVKKDVSKLEKEAQDEEEKKELKSIDAITDAIDAKMTIKFISDKTAELSMDMQFDEQKAKEGGASWLMRKFVKMKIGKGRSEKGQTTYTVNGRTVTITGLKKKEKRVCELSDDGKKLSMVADNKKVVLTRIK